MGQISNELDEKLRELRQLIPRLPWGHKGQLRSTVRLLRALSKDIRKTERRRRHRYTKQKEIRAIIEKTCKRCGFPKLGSKIPFTFNKRYTDSLGAAGGGAIEFSTLLWARATPEQRKQVIIHEVCHVLAEEKYGDTIKPHGEEWQSMMRIAGTQPLIYHEVDNDDLYKPQKRFNIRCLSCNAIIRISKNKRTRLKNGKQYPCKKCRKLLTAKALKGTRCQ